MWASIHLICIGAPESLDAAQQQAYRTFFNSLPDVIPCSVCSTHLRSNLKTLPVDNYLATNKDLFKWSVALHNLVNKQLHKPQMPDDFAYDVWKKICDNKSVSTSFKNNSSSNGFYGFVLGVLTAAILAWMVLMYKSKKR